MSAAYKPVGWTRAKLVYDAVALLAISGYILAYLRLAPRFQSVTLPPDPGAMRIAAFGSCAFLLLSLVLCIGPLARLDRRFLPLLYNRRHLGALTAMVALAHADFVLYEYFGFSRIDRFTALISGNTSYAQIRGFPFEIFGAFGLAILILLAATSHDFWLRFLTPPLWKALHMAIYLAYASIVIHVALGHLQGAAFNPVFLIFFVLSVASVVTLHLLAGRRETRGGDAAPEAAWIAAGMIGDIEESFGRVVELAGGERVAIFRHRGRLSAVTNLCAHQNGPLGEGRVVDGCVTCPWHGYQYRLEDGCAPPPFTEKLATYRLKLEGERILLDPKPNPPGSYVEPLSIGGA